MGGVEGGGGVAIFPETSVTVEYTSPSVSSILSTDGDKDPFCPVLSSVGLCGVSSRGLESIFDCTLGGKSGFKFSPLGACDTSLFLISTNAFVVLLTVACPPVLRGAGWGFLVSLCTLYGRGLGGTAFLGGAIGRFLTRSDFTGTGGLFIVLFFLTGLTGLKSFEAVNRTLSDGGLKKSKQLYTITLET